MVTYESKIFKEAVESVPLEIKRMVAMRFDIADRIYSVMQKKGLTNTQFANLMGKKEPEIAKWISGSHNFTIDTLMKISAALGEDIILCAKDE